MILIVFLTEAVELLATHAYSPPILMLVLKICELVKFSSLELLDIVNNCIALSSVAPGASLFSTLVEDRFSVLFGLSTSIKLSKSSSKSDTSKKY